MPTYYAPGENSAAAIKFFNDAMADVKISRKYVRPGRPKGPPKPKQKPKPVPLYQRQSRLPPANLSSSKPRILRPVSKPTTKEQQVTAHREWMSGPLSPKFQARQAALVESVEELDGWSAGPKEVDYFPNEPQFRPKESVYHESNEATGNGKPESQQEYKDKPEFQNVDVVDVPKVTKGKGKESTELTSSTGSEFAVAPEVQAAREEFNKTFEKLFHPSATIQNYTPSEYQLNYIWHEASKPEPGSVPKDTGIFFPSEQQLPEAPGRVSADTILPEWLRSSPGELEATKSEAEKYPSDQLSHSVELVKSAKRSDSLRNNCTVIDMKKPVEPNLETLRERFTDEISRLHRTDIHNPFVTEYDDAFADPPCRKNTLEECGAIVDDIVEKTLSKAAKPALATEYESAFSHEELRDAVKGATHKYDYHSFLSSGEMDNPPSSEEEPKESKFNVLESEYHHSFKPLDQRQAEREIATNSKSEKQGLLTEYEACYSSPSTQIKDKEYKPKRSNAPRYETEYQARYLRAEQRKPKDISEPFRAPDETVPLPAKFIPPVDPSFVTVYQDAFERHHHGGLPEDKTHVEVEEIKPVTPFFVTEYQRAFEMNQKVVSNDSSEEKQGCLKPYYSIPPKHQHKHKLFKSEITRGFVPKSEYMAKYPDYTAIIQKAIQANKPPATKDVLQMTA